MAQIGDKIGPNQIRLHGMFSWELLVDIDNADNNGSFERKLEIKTLQSSSYDKLEKKLVLSSDETSNVLKGTLFTVKDIDVKDEVPPAIRLMYDNLSEKITIVSEEITKTDKIIVGPNSRCKLYRLVFTGPGVSYATDTLSSTPHPMDNVIIDVTIKQMHVLHYIDIHITDHSIKRPSNAIQLIKGFNADTNAGFGGLFVWLVPIWTLKLAEAATGIDVVIQKEFSNDYQDMARGAGGEYRYIKILRDPYHHVGITKIGLYRTADGSDDPLRNGWGNRSIDINKGRGGDFLYLVWNTQSLQNHC